MPGLGIVIHVGRTSKRRYRTPVNAFRTRGVYVIALTYGTRADWVRNVRASGGCELETRGRRIRLISPRVIHDPRVRLAPWITQPILRMLHVTDLLQLETAGDASLRRKERRTTERFSSPVTWSPHREG
jgi:deazaflavin-dependent oxidoreductase (nitroreductase family)